MIYNANFSFNQEWNQNQLWHYSHAFFHTLHQLPVITSSFDWFAVLCVFFVIGCSNYLVLVLRHSTENHSITCQYFLLILAARSEQFKNHVSLFQVCSIKTINLCYMALALLVKKTLMIIVLNKTGNLQSQETNSLQTWQNYEFLKKEPFTYQGEMHETL